MPSLRVSLVPQGMRQDVELGQRLVFALRHLFLHNHADLKGKMLTPI
jgi:hypothetical protein